MRTIVVMHVPEISGPARSLYPRLSALAARGSLEVIVPADGPVAQLYGGVGEIQTLAYGPLMFPTDVLEMMRATFSLARMLRTFRARFRTAQPDLVVVATAFLPAVLLAARLERVPTIVYVGEMLDPKPGAGRARRLAASAVARFTERLADAIICASRTVAAQFRGASGKPLVAVYPGVESTEARSDRFRLRDLYEIPREALCMAVVGNITVGRRQDLAIEALARVRERVPDARCLIAGVPHPRPIDLAYRARLAELASRLGVSDAVVYLGFVDPIDDVYAGADVIVNPVTIREGAGRVALEALAAGSPVVASRIGAIPEVLRDGRDALLVPPDDPGALADAVCEIWFDEALRSRLIASGRARVQKEFDVARTTSDFLRVVDEVLADHPHLGRSLTGRPSRVRA